MLRLIRLPCMWVHCQLNYLYLWQIMCVIISILTCHSVLHEFGFQTCTKKIHSSASTENLQHVKYWLIHFYYMRFNLLSRFCRTN